MILRKMSSCLWKLEPGFQTYGIVCLLAQVSQVFRPQTPGVTALGSKSFSMSSSIIFSMKQAFIFKFWVIFDKFMSVYSLKNCKKPIKNLVYGAIPMVLFKSCHKNTLFWSTKIQISPEPLGQIQKINPFWNPVIKVFKMT